MILHIKTLLIISTLFFSCKNEGNSNVSVNNTTLNKKEVINQTLERQNTKEAIQTNNIFSFYKSFPFCDNDSGYFSQKEADKLFASKKLDLQNHNFSTINFVEILSQELVKCIEINLELTDNLVFKQTTTNLSFPFDTVYSVDKYILVFQDGFFFVFNKKENSNSIPLKKNSVEITKLPLKFDVYSDIKKVKLPVEGINLKKHNYKETYLTYLPKKDNLNPIIFSGCYELGTCDEYLIVLDDKSNEVSKLKLYYHEAPDGNIEKYSYSEYEIDESYNITVINYKVIEDLSNQQIIDKKESKTYFSINNKGEIIQK